MSAWIRHRLRELALRGDFGETKDRPAKAPPPPVAAPPATSAEQNTRSEPA